MKGEDIKDAIRKTGISLDDAAAMLGMSRQTLYNNLNREKPTYKFVEKVKKEFSQYFDLSKIAMATKEQPVNTMLELNEQDYPYGVDTRVLNKIILEKEKQILKMEIQLDNKDEFIKKLEAQLEDYRYQSKVNDSQANTKRRSA